MNKRLLLGLCMVLSCFITMAQTATEYMRGPNKRTCESHNVYLKQMQNEKFARNQQKVEENYRAFLKNPSSMRAGEIRTIPVYVHVIYNTSQENISDAQINSQIDVINKDFTATNSDIGNTPSEFAGVVADYQIQFQLVQITRKQSSRTSWGTNDDMKKSSQGGVDPITPDTHLNMWVCNIGGGILGYAQFPGGSASTDGVVMSPNYFGSSDGGSGFYLSAPFDKGRTTTHEIGHYLNLRHIWGDGGCSVDDFVSDTPTSDGANYGCTSYPDASCGSNDMTMNFMDYSDDACMYMFTEGQKARTASIFASGGSRENLGTVSGGCSLGAPGNLSSSNIGDNGFTLSWNSVSGANGYDVTVGGSTATVSGTSYTASGLTAGTSYATSVVANCSGGGSGSAANLSVTTTGSNCQSDGNVTITLNFDNYPEETSWTITSGGSTVASGGTYGSQADGSTLTINETLNSGSYTFTINDSYGDGICCSYGSGSYTVTSNGNTLASGGSFGSSESTNFCVEATADTQAPTTPGSLSASNISTSGFDLSWSASSDNVGVTGYDVTVGGNTTSVTGTSTSISGLAEGTTYNVSVIAKDAAGNTSSAASTSVTTATSSNCFKSNVTLTLTTDRYASETTWTLKDGSGNTIASNGSLSNSTTYNQSFTLGNGNYTFTINDSYGDGICCGYGNGSYSLTDGTGASIVSGGNFGSTESTDFCIDGSSSKTQNQINLGNEISELSVNVFPSPASTLLNVELSKIGFVSIYNTSGQLVYSEKMIRGRNTMNISNLKAGLYIVRVVGEDGISKKTRFLKK